MNTAPGLPLDNQPSEIEKNAWQPENFVRDVENKVLKVSYREKYGSELVIYCMAFFNNDKTKQYKAVAPWLGSTIIEKENITEITIREVDKKEYLDSTKS